MASPVVYVQALLNRETSAGKITLPGEVFCAILTSFGFQAANAFYQIRICHIYIIFSQEWAFSSLKCHTFTIFCTRLLLSCQPFLFPTTRLSNLERSLLQSRKRNGVW